MPQHQFSSENENDEEREKGDEIEDDREEAALEIKPRQVRLIPLTAGFPGLPVEDEKPNLKVAIKFLNEEIRPRREWIPPDDPFEKAKSKMQKIADKWGAPPECVEEAFTTGLRAGEKAYKGKMTNAERAREERGEEPGQWTTLEMGSPGGELFPLWNTSPGDLKEFGLGVAMYFQTLQLLCATFMACFLFQYQTIDYYSGKKYSDRQVGISFWLRGSAICTKTMTVCTDSVCSNTDIVNLCQMNMVIAYFDLSITCLLFVLFMAVGVIQNAVSEELDESIQTAQDYSVVVDDPDPSEQDPEDWRQFFSQFGHVTFVTVAKNNGKLLKALCNRRAVMREIMMMIGNGKIDYDVEEDDDGILDMTWVGSNGETLGFNEKMDDFIHMSHEAKSSAQRMRNLIEKAGIFGMVPMSTLKKALAKTNEKVQEALNSANYTTSKVFITFETEHAQRRCLSALTHGFITTTFDVGRNRLDPKTIYKGKDILTVIEAPEPAVVIWQDIDVTVTGRLQQQCVTWTITLMLVCGSVVACRALKTGMGAGAAAMWIALTNILVPSVIRYLCTKMEVHMSLDDQQMSFFLKLAFFRWMNTAIVLYLITEFDEFLTEKAIEQVRAVLFADAFTAPIIRTLNPMGIVTQRIISRFAHTQEKMNTYFLGEPWFLAERYADMTKALFLSLFYSALFPNGNFLTSCGYLVGYMVDKLALLRTWRTPAELNDTITQVSRGHLFLGVYFHVCMTMIFYASFPFDNLCVDKEAGTLLPTRFSWAQEMLNVTSDVIYKECEQKVTGRVFGLFLGGDLLRESMYKDQVKAVRIYSVFFLVLTGIIFVVGFGQSIVRGIIGLFTATYDPGSDPNEDHYSEQDIEAYIPLISHPILQYPLIATDTETFEDKYLPFSLSEDDGDGPLKELYKMQSLFNNYEIPGCTKEQLQELFSEVRYFECDQDDIDEKEQQEKDDAHKIALANNKRLLRNKRMQAVKSLGRLAFSRSGKSSTLRRYFDKWVMNIDSEAERHIHMVRLPSATSSVTEDFVDDAPSIEGAIVEPSEYGDDSFGKTRKKNSRYSRGGPIRGTSLDDVSVITSTEEPVSLQMSPVNLAGSQDEEEEEEENEII